jgi:cytochrome c biogenesis protein CcmG, thiol:disulfide interchange protein DsbE
VKRWVVFTPLVVVLLLGGLFIYGLGRDDPKLIKTGMLGKAVPRFATQDLARPQLPGLTSTSFAKGEVVLVNFFASWCAPCAVEHAQLMTLAQKHNVKIYGIAYKDSPANAQAFLQRLGNPYTQVGLDLTGDAGIEFGITGVPETYIIRADGVIGFRHAGPIMPKHIEQRFLPILRDLQKNPKALSGQAS